MKLSRSLVVALIALASASVFSKPPAAPKPVSLGALYARYEKAGFSTLDMKERNHPFLITGVAISRSKSLAGTSLLTAAAAENPDTGIARLVPADDEEDAAMQAIPDGSPFKAVCTLSFTSGSDYLAFEDCVFKSAAQ